MALLSDPIASVVTKSQSEHPSIRSRHGTPTTGLRAAMLSSLLPLAMAALFAIHSPAAHSAEATRSGAAVDQAYTRYRAGDVAGAVQDYLAHAAAGDPIAAYNAAVIRLRDESTEPDEQTAIALLRKSAEAGFAIAQHMLGTLYERGDLIAADQVEALAWFERAARQGIVDAQLAAATQHFLGRGTPKDYHRALDWYRLAAEGGDGAAAYIAGSMYEHGDGTGVDLRAALQWYAASARQGDEVARLKAREIAERIAATAQ